MITPQTRQQLTHDVAEKFKERTLGSIKYALDHGWLLWEMKKPQERLQGYYKSTWPDDLQFVLNKDYLDLFKAGVMPPLHAMQVYAQSQQPQIDPASGQPMPPQPLTDTQLMFWALLAPPALPDFVMRRFQADFIHLVEAEQKKGNTTT